MCMLVYFMCVLCPQKSEDSIRVPDTGDTDNYEPTCGCWEPNPPEEQPVLIITEPSLKTSTYAFKNLIKLFPFSFLLYHIQYSEM